MVVNGSQSQGTLTPRGSAVIFDLLPDDQEDNLENIRETLNSSMGSSTLSGSQSMPSTPVTPMMDAMVPPLPPRHKSRSPVAMVTQTENDMLKLAGRTVSTSIETK